MTLKKLKGIAATTGLDWDSCGEGDSGFRGRKGRRPPTERTDGKDRCVNISGARRISAKGAQKQQRAEKQMRLGSSLFASPIFCGN